MLGIVIFSLTIVGDIKAPVATSSTLFNFFLRILSKIKLYVTSGAQAGPDMNAGQQGGAQDNTKHGDNVQDADFEEVK